MKALVFSTTFLQLFIGSIAWSHPSPEPKSYRITTRTNFLSEAAYASIVLGGIFGGNPQHSKADDLKPKLRNLSDDELKAIVTSDMVSRSFLVSADLTREIYDESATFTDEIDTYTLPKWIQGTKRLFVADGSRVDLVGDVLVSPEKVEFKFDEDLMFNIPFKPVVHLTGSVVLKRSADTGLITSYQEIWDQDVATVLKSAKFK